MIRAGALLAVLLAGAVLAEDLDVQTEAYRSAARSGALGAVTGHLAPDGRTQSRTRASQAAITIVLVPRSPRLLAALQNVRHRSRDSLWDYVASIAELRRLWQTYEEGLRGAGAADLIRTATANANGDFAVDDLPAGSWILIAEQVAPLRGRKPPRIPKKDQTVFAGRPASGGSRGVTVWLLELTIEGSRAEAVELTDRNAWFEGVEEGTTPGAVEGGRRQGR
jgi:hypothetical protein